MTVTLFSRKVHLRYLVLMMAHRLLQYKYSVNQAFIKAGIRSHTMMSIGQPSTYTNLKAPKRTPAESQKLYSKGSKP